MPKNHLITRDSAELGAYAEVTQWARFERTPAYQTKAVLDFLNHADSWLVASAAAFDVSCYTNLEFLESENIRF